MKIPQTPEEQAIQGHRIWHLAPTTMMRMFGIPRKLAERINNECHACKHLREPNRHIQDKQRPIKCPPGPNLIVNVDIKYMSSNSHGPRYLIGAYHSDPETSVT